MKFSEEPMSHDAQRDALQKQLDSFIERFVLEYDLSLYDIVVALQVKTFYMMQQLANEQE